jgi:hypothetical protein
MLMFEESVDLTVQAKVGAFEWKAEGDGQWSSVPSNSSGRIPGGKRQGDPQNLALTDFGRLFACWLGGH